MRGEYIDLGKLLSDLLGQIGAQPTRHIDRSEFGMFLLRIIPQFLLFSCEVSGFGIRLRAHRDIFARRH